MQNLYHYSGRPLLSNLFFIPSSHGYQDDQTDIANSYGDNSVLYAGKCEGF